MLREISLRLEAINKRKKRNVSGMKNNARRIFHFSEEILGLYLNSQ